MAQGISQTALNHSSLVRALADLAVVEVPESKQSFADRLGQWLGFNEALSLYSVLNADAGDASSARAGRDQGVALRSEFKRVRGALLDDMAPTSLSPGEDPTDFSPYHRYYLIRQRQMSNDIGLLRAQARTALARRSPALKRLAALDTVMEQALAVRERSLLATLPGLLSRRFEQLGAPPRAAPSESSGADEAGQGQPAHDWLADFCRDMRAVLLAELELRLQPIDGLIAALENEVADKQ